MYCRKCGKEIDYDAEYCLECEGREKEVVQPVYYEQPQQPQASVSEPNGPGRTEGIGRAITASVLSVVAFMLSAIAIGVIYDSVGACIVMFIASIPFAIVSMVNGSKSIKVFQNAVTNRYPKPVATLVCGIVGLSIGAFALTYAFLGFCLAAM